VDEEGRTQIKQDCLSPVRKLFGQKRVKKIATAKGKGGDRRQSGSEYTSAFDKLDRRTGLGPRHTANLDLAWRGEKDTWRQLERGRKGNGQGRNTKGRPIS